MIYMPHHARVTRGPHASCHVASVPRRNVAVDPRATSARRLGPVTTLAAAGPVRHVGSAWARSPRQPQVISPLFAILTKKNQLKIQIKIGKRA